MSEPTFTEAQAIMALQRIAKRWPKSLWLFAGGSAGHALFVMRKNRNGSRAVLPGGGMDPETIVATIEIESDGGDW